MSTWQDPYFHVHGSNLIDLTPIKSLAFFQNILAAYDLFFDLNRA